MKEFLTTVKGKVIAGAITLLAVGGILAAVIIMNSGYRVVSVEALTGKSTITNGSNASDAYVGLHLKGGDDVRVGTLADMTLSMDADKYMYAEPETHFWIEAKGKQGDTKTNVHLDAGSSLMRIDNKLNDSESFNVDTPNATMSVRGTVFRVTYSKDTDGYNYTLIEVFEGSVYVESVMEDKSSVTDSRLLTSGMSALIKSNPDDSEFVVDENGDVVSNIKYKEIPKETAKYLGKTMDSGRTLCITKDLLYDYVTINPHDFCEKSEDSVEATCEEAGFYYLVCSICGEKESKRVEVEATGHKAITVEERGATCQDDVIVKTVCEDCNVVLDTQIVKGGSHLWDNGTVTKEATCTVDGEKTIKCEECGEVKTEVITKLGHSYSVTEETKPTCTAQGTATEVCSRCKDKKTKTTEATGHSYIETARTASTCTVDGTITETCSLCGNVKNTSIPASGHSYAETGRTNPTCTASGSSTKTCSACGDVKTDTLAATGHNYTETGRSAATCSRQGEIFYNCSVCGDRGTPSVIPMTPHSTTMTFTSYSEHAEICNVCGTTISTAPHTPGSYTPDPSGTGHNIECSACGSVYYFDQHHKTINADGSLNPCTECGDL